LNASCRERGGAFQRVSWLHARATRRVAGLLVTAMVALSGPAPAAQAAPPVEPFDAATWGRLRAQLPRPAIVVFSTTYCAHCPEVFAYLAQAIRQRGLAGPLVAVVMDGEERPGFAGDPHFRLASRLFAFRGDEIALRHAVDPRWRGETPYVALLRAGADPVFVAGRPTEEQIERLARPLR
jgi:hypothetical protein